MSCLFSGVLEVFVLKKKASQRKGTERYAKARTRTVSLSYATLLLLGANLKTAQVFVSTSQRAMALCNFMDSLLLFLVYRHPLADWLILH